MNLIGEGNALILIEPPTADCMFMNGIYTGQDSSAIKYGIDKTTTKAVQEINIIKAPGS